MQRGTVTCHTTQHTAHSARCIRIAHFRPLVVVVVVCVCMNEAKCSLFLAGSRVPCARLAHAAPKEASLSTVSFCSHSLRPVSCCCVSTRELVSVELAAIVHLSLFAPVSVCCCWSPRGFFVFPTANFLDQNCAVTVWHPAPLPPTPLRSADRHARRLLPCPAHAPPHSAARTGATRRTAQASRSAKRAAPNPTLRNSASRSRQPSSILILILILIRRRR